MNMSKIGSYCFPGCWCPVRRYTSLEVHSIDSRVFPVSDFKTTILKIIQFQRIYPLPNYGTSSSLHPTRSSPSRPLVSVNSYLLLQLLLFLNYNENPHYYF